MQDTNRLTEPRTYRIEGMHCAACVGRVERALQSIDAIEDVRVNLSTGHATVRSVEQEFPSLETLQEAVQRAGYQLVESSDGQHESQTQLRLTEYQQLRRRVLVAVPLTLAVFVLSMFVWEFAGKTLLLSTLTGVVLGWSGRSIFASAMQGLRHGALNMDTLVAMGSGVAFLVSVLAMLFPNLWSESPPIYFEAAAMIVFFVLVGRMLEEKAKWRTASAIDELIQLQPQTATLWNKGEQEQDVPIEQLHPEDIIRVRPGERIPMDGVVWDGTGTVDESMVTGESMPVTKQAGDEVIGGTINQSGGMLITVTRTGADTVLHQIVELVRSAQSSKAPIARLADRVAGIFVPVVIAIAVVTFLVWLSLDFTSAGFSHAVLAAVTVLVISCPCALGLATPTAMMTAMGRSAQLGLMIKDAATIEQAARLQTLIFDKTGTLTKGELSVTSVRTINAETEQDVLRLAAAVEQHSEHPLAKAIVQRYTIAARNADEEQSDSALRELPVWGSEPDNFVDIPASENFKNVAGQGASAVVEGTPILVGNERYLRSHGVDQELPQPENSNASFVYVAQDSDVLGTIEFADELKQESASAIGQLREMGYDLLLVSGDRAATVEAIALQVGIRTFHAEVLPDEKVQLVEDVAQSGKVVAMIGDGINDAPALAAADVGIAIGAGTDVAIAAAGMTVLSDQITPIVRGLRLARRTMEIVRQNLFFAFIYNLIGIPFAAGILYPWTGWLLPPMFAAAAMSLSSLSVVSNSLRLRNAG